MWYRSVELHNMRYITMLSDGDSKLYEILEEKMPYGPEHPVLKEECINHVGKRLGTALRNLVHDNTKRGITLGGKGYGRLTLNTITKLQLYYSRAIRGNKTAAAMKSAIYATLTHCFSTDENPTHTKCPQGDKSWCFYNRAVANKKPPQPHKKFLHTPLDKNLVWKHMKPIYQRLTTPQLLSRCELKGTQNANESLHSVIWGSRLSKTDFYSRPRVEFCTLLGIGEFNFGPAYSLEARKLYKITQSYAAVKLSQQREKKRLKKSKQREIAKMTNERQKKREGIAKMNAELEAAEGGPAYGAGIAAVPGSTKRKGKAVKGKPAKKTKPSHL